MSLSDRGPTLKDVLSSREAPDGQKRYGFFSSELKNERKQWAKLALPVRATECKPVQRDARAECSLCRRSGSSPSSCSSSCRSTLVRTTRSRAQATSLTTGSYYLQIPRAAHFTVQVIDLDSAASPSGATHPAILGPAVATAIDNQRQSLPHLGWLQADEATTQLFRLTSDGRGLDAFEYATDRVNNQDVWAVLIVNANATSGVWDAITSGAQWDRECETSEYQMAPQGLANTNHNASTDDSLWCDDIRVRGSAELLRR
jgi:hypothetical protein